MPRGSNLPSIMGHDFSSAGGASVPRSVFARNTAHKTTFSAGQLIPFFVDEILPGDTLALNAQIFARLSTFIFPIMDNVFIDTFFFFVPNRLVWDNWERFQGAQDDPDDPIDFELPVIEAQGDPAQFELHDLADYFGLPVGVTMDVLDKPQSLPFRSYNLIWNEWFRDQNIQSSVVVDTDDGPDSIVSYPILYRNKRHDYFSSCLPWPQKGDGVSIPLGSTAPVIGTGISLGLTDGTDGYGVFGVLTPDNSTFSLKINQESEAIPVGTAATVPGTGPGVNKIMGVTNNPDNSGMMADLSLATAATINQLREAFAIQQILELDARGGTRYVEHLKAHWGVISPDYRLQRPEYLGGASQRVDVRGVPQTGSTDGVSPQGNLAAYSQVGSRSGFNKSFVEHGHVIGLVNVRADVTYQQGMRRMWSRKTRFDFYMPALAHLGEQAVFTKELFYFSAATADDVFGYQERWSEYRYFPSMVTGLFRSNAAGTLDSWHLALDFAGAPLLNDSFLRDNPPLDRVIAVADEPHVLFDSFIQIRHARCMPVYSIPGLQRL